jgi:hypothetical protein
MLDTTEDRQNDKRIERKTIEGKMKRYKDRERASKKILSYKRVSKDTRLLRLHNKKNVRYNRRERESWDGEK